MPARNSQRDTAKAEYIKRRRAGEKINLKEFADRVGVPYGTVRNWKRIDQWDESLERKRGGQPETETARERKMPRATTAARRGKIRTQKKTAHIVPSFLISCPMKKRNGLTICRPGQKKTLCLSCESCGIDRKRF